jgi:uncharacterized phage protein (TIGR01671 family)
MSREIKFRAWDGIRMTTTGIQFNNTTGELLFIPKGTLMQYTGLRDRKGVEIYEGDIAKITWAEGTYRGSAYGGALNYTELGVMQFDNGQFSFFVKDSLLDDDYKNLTVEIIGNIYQHKHLLEAKDE